MSTLRCEVSVPRPIAEVFAFFADASNLEAITPPWLRFEVLTPRPIEMRRGVLIDYRLRIHGVPLRWRSEITVWEPPHRFVDEQRRGPYRRWRHLHGFREIDGPPVVEDLVEYAVLGGALVDRLFVRRDLEKIFAFRGRRLLEILAPRSGSEESRV